MLYFITINLHIYVIYVHTYTKNHFEKKAVTFKASLGKENYINQERQKVPFLKKQL